ncbi:PAS domain-containing protein [Desulfobaculum bizertense]|uniref:PAS domain-containing protein n=1 Tax=Desulfobaculum bizertense TaxID=376490 RepID=UPI001F48472E|nr:PAS domain-containing protein [Desulfobaculum bizertense]UIJ37784.1 PAS domain-containing protein [Desulfobaculum bizertense]
MKLQHRLHSLPGKIILAVGLTLFCCVAAWAFMSIRFQREHSLQSVIESTDRLSDTTRLALHYAMLHNSRDDIRQIVRNTSRQRSVESVKIFDHSGIIQYSSTPSEEQTVVKNSAPACAPCHRAEPPLRTLDLAARSRLSTADDGIRRIHILTPIFNEASCSGPPCHAHNPDTRILGALDMTVSLATSDAASAKFERNTLGMAAFAFLSTSWIMILLVLGLVKEPLRRLIAGTRLLAAGKSIPLDRVDPDDEMGELVIALNQMGKDISTKQQELNAQRNLYRNFFNNVPCLITVVDRNFRILDYNDEFAEHFCPVVGEHCFKTWKGREKKCQNCPVEKTFQDGQSHSSEESGIHSDGSPAHWIVSTQPLRNEDGEIYAALEMCLNISARRELEKKLALSEKKYHDIFNHIPNPVFVLDAESLEIQDGNQAIFSVYGRHAEQLAGSSFLELFVHASPEELGRRLRMLEPIHQVQHQRDDGEIRSLDIMASPSLSDGRPVLLVITRDITTRLETEQQLIQASKMTTLGEMATGVAHELNQPLTVIQTIGGLMRRRVEKNAALEPELLRELYEGISHNVERATDIITHLREFGRKPGSSEMEAVDGNTVLQRAYAMFDRQLTAHGFETQWQLAPDLPQVMARANRLEQIFINLILNARDAVNSRREQEADAPSRIILSSSVNTGRVLFSIEDSGTGFPPAIASRLFEPFFTTKDVGKGTGLGLSISYSLMQSFGGTIEAANSTRPDMGARFTLVFPASALAPQGKPD